MIRKRFRALFFYLSISHCYDQRLLVEEDCSCQEKKIEVLYYCICAVSFHEPCASVHGKTIRNCPSKLIPTEWSSFNTQMGRKYSKVKGNVLLDAPFPASRHAKTLVKVMDHTALCELEATLLPRIIGRKLIVGCRLTGTHMGASCFTISFGATKPFFHVDGFVNNHNCHFSGPKRVVVSHPTVEKRMIDQRSVWLCMTSSQVVDSFLYLGYIECRLLPDYVARCLAYVDQLLFFFFFFLAHPHKKKECRTPMV